MLSMKGIKIAPTKKILCLSLFHLLETSSLDVIPTKAIYETVGVSANSFYYHFRDKYDCASYVFRIILFQAMGGKFSSPDCFFEDISDMRSIYAEMNTLRQLKLEDSSEGALYGLWMEKWNDMWYSMAMYVRTNARMQFINIYNSRETNSPYYELQSAWEKYFSHIQAGMEFKNDRRRDFFKDAMFSFWELYVFKFALNPDYDFQPNDAKLLMHIRKNVIGTVEDI